MSGVDNLENLDNKALREKCLAYGLPNIPITDTSRKLLIKRLRIAMDGGEKVAEKSKSRRETIHVIKVDTEASKVAPTQKATPTKAKAAGRRTIGTPNLPAEDEPQPPARATVTQRRRSGRTTPISQLEPVEPQSTKRKAADIIKEDEEEEEPIQIPVIIEKSTVELSRQTRAPSLSKSVVVTTSYVKDVPNEIVELDDTEPEDEDEEVEMEPEPEIEIEPVRYKYLSSSRNYDTTKPFSLPLEKGSYTNYSAGSLSHPSRISLSKGPTAAVSYEPTATRRYTAGGYKTITEGYENKTFVHHTDLEETKDDKLDTPYLSDFARRLSRLKPEPVSPVISTPVKGDRDVHYYPTSVSARRGIAQNGTVSDSFYKLLIALDRKYNLKRNFTIFAVILAIVLVYVLFF